MGREENLGKFVLIFGLPAVLILLLVLFSPWNSSAEEDIIALSVEGRIQKFYFINGSGMYEAEVKTKEGTVLFPIGLFVDFYSVNNQVKIGDSIRKKQDSKEMWIFKNNQTKRQYIYPRSRGLLFKD